MTTTDTQAESSATSPARLLDGLIEIALVAILLFMALALGAVEQWSELVAMALGALIAVLLAIRLILYPAPLGRSRALIAIAAYLLLIGFQLAPLPAPLVRLIAPATAAKKVELLGDLPNAPDALRWMTLSFYPHATVQTLRLVLLATIVFVTVLTLYREARAIRRLLLWLALIGAVIAGIALLQDVLRAPNIYWRIRTGVPANSGPFINHSHYAQFMNLTIAAALALFLASLAPAQSGRRRVAWWTLAVVVAGLATIALSLSRGGLLSVVGAGAITLALLAWRHAARGAAAMLLTGIVIAFCIVLYFGFDDVYERIVTLNAPRGYGARPEMVRDALHIFKEHPITGVGLGAHEVVFPAYEQQLNATIAEHVENEYVEAAEETGVVGLAGIAALVAILGLAFLRALRRSDLAISAAAVGLGYGLIAVLLHSVTDYGQHIPAVACMSAVICALLINLGAKPQMPSRTISLTIAAFLLLSAAWLLFASLSAWRGEAAWKRAESIGDALRDNGWTGADSDYDQLLALARQAVAAQPRNIVYRQWLSVYRWHALSRNTTPGGQVILTPTQLAEVERIVADLNDSRKLCPTYGPLYAFVGELESSVLAQPIGEEHIRRAFALAPNDAVACLLSGEVEARHNRVAEARSRLQRAIALNYAMLNDVIDFYLHDLHDIPQAIDSLDNDHRYLMRLTEALSNDPAHRAEHDRVLSRAIELLKRRCDQPDAPPADLVALAGELLGQNDYAGAERYLRRAIAIDFAQGFYHYQLARALIGLHQNEPAVEELRAAVRFDPNFGPARQLLLNLTAEPR